MALVGLLKELAIAGGKALGGVLVRAITRAVAPMPEPDPADATPLTYRHVEHNRRQEQQSIEASKRAEAEKRTRPTERPPKR